ncbi:hypothetical protein COCSUDRAFT_83570 [Coccomyxa subellipsoidea C-169]|uniref:Multiple C2 domain-containing protein n=1 Tax=Coccomyxa subellipsoidea (strain C-169) TaxID=574566 RepID=I0Z8P2_COCSC|nr:hypothetical protein COCSUDRAFT_83570 [Coccomyxa subellipsoidea C-169]EIE27011.1 hypothetical protein COCSUDRAFT_83570 [Coccomyxa subellipsoidea C-169]|eukprot:XP_005651555.1 hypothetical protein COCSUDRAFT_83570 [Coccomyxa subellipsoidea C-169]
MGSGDSATAEGGQEEQSNELASSSGKSSQGTDSLGDKGGGEQKAQDEPECAEQQPKRVPRIPEAKQPLGMLQLVIKSVDLEQGSDSCFCLLRCGPLWGRSTTQPYSNHLEFSWEVHAPIFDPGTVLQLALFKETGPRTSRRTTMVGQLRIRLSSLSTDVLHSARLPLCASRQKGGERSATADLAIKARPHSVFFHFWSKLAGGDDLAYLGSPATGRSECLQFSIAQVSYFSRLRLLRGYLSPPRPVGMYRHGLAGGDVRRTLERETARITMRWLESSSPPIPRSVADCLLRSPQDMFLMSRTKAHWRRLSVWVEAGKEASEGWAYLQSWDNPPATIGTMAAMTALCCYPHITISLGATALVIYMVFAYPSEGVGEPMPMEPDPEAKEDDDDTGDNELQGTLVQRLQARVENMQRIALKVQNALDEIASALERVRAVVCWADPNASSFFLIIATVAALLVPLLGLHTLISFLLCWMLRPPFLRVPRPPPPYSFLLRLPNKADQIP